MATKSVQPTKPLGEGPGEADVALDRGSFGRVSYDEIAELLGSSPAAARRSVSDALANLRRHHQLRPDRPDPTEGPS